MAGPRTGKREWVSQRLGDWPQQPQMRTLEQVSLAKPAEDWRGKWESHSYFWSSCKLPRTRGGTQLKLADTRFLLSLQMSLFLFKNKHHIYYFLKVREKLILIMKCSVCVNKEPQQSQGATLNKTHLTRTSFLPSLSLSPFLPPIK